MPLFSTAEAGRHGIGPDRLRAALRSSDIVLVRRGWYAPAAPCTPDEAYRRRCLADQATIGLPLSGASALAALGLPLFDTEHRPTYLVGDRRRSSAGIVISPGLGGDPRLAPGGRCVDIVDAIVSAALVDPELALAAADAGCRFGRTRAADIGVRAVDIGSRRGSVGARTALGLIDPRRESVGESRCAWRCHGWGIPLLPQVVIRTDAGDFRVDFLVEGTNLVLEFDGAVKYDAPDALWREKQREDALRRAGYVVIRVTWADLYAPDRLLIRLRGALTTVAA